MTEEQKTPESQKNTWDLLDVVTSRVGKITALIGAITGLVVGANQLIPKSGPGDPKTPVVPVVNEAPRSPALANCIKPKMIVEPETVAFSKRESIMLKLTGRDDCPAPLSAYVTFKMANDRVRIMSPHTECVLNDPLCWEQVTIDRGDVPLAPPRMFLISKPLDEPVKLGINWVVYNVEDKKQLRAGTVQITLQNDP